jgi:adenine-specific DNA-methyltransferase
MKQLPDGCVDAVITDPPYLVSYLGRYDSDWKPIHGDDDYSWVLPVFTEAYRVLSSSGVCISFYGWPNVEVFVGAWKALGFRLLSHIVWIKNIIGLGYFTRGQHEQAFLLGKPKARKPATAISDVLEWTRVNDSQHPTQKPEDAIAPLVEQFVEELSGMVLDPFAGSGTTLVAAKKLGRHFLGFEISPEYCEIARKRLDAIDAQPSLFTPKPEQMTLEGNNG